MLFHLILLLLVASLSVAQSNCRCIPGDGCWPSAQDWATFNQSIGGKLIATEMLASVCHVPTFNNASCQLVKDEWYQPAFHDDSSSSIMSALAANNSCSPFTDPQTTCQPGNAVAFGVNATAPSDFTSAIRYARAKNLRLVIRNTGHDYMGKSTGRGALSIWTHHMKNMDFLNYTSSEYTGPAVRLGAGIQVEEGYRRTGEVGSVIVSGACETVGFAGGYVTGGGHSGLSSKYGLAADQTLEFEVVDGRGNLLKANRKENSDLYWALSGGGGGTYSVVVSVTVKLFPDMQTTGVSLKVTHDPSRSDDFYAAVQAYRDLIPAITAKGGMSADAVFADSFVLTPLTLPGLTRDEAADLLRPFLDHLNATNMDYDIDIVQSPSYYQHWNTTIRPNPNQLVQNAQYGGWLVSLDVIRNQGAALTKAMLDIVEGGCFAAGIGLNVSKVVDNAVQPGWRDTAMFVILFTPWPQNATLDQMAVAAKNMTEVCVPALSRLSPDTGAYLNEADYNQPDWQTAFYGPNYARLLSIKHKYDPDGMFYAHTAVGSDERVYDSAGRLCNVN